jgi:phthalate 4,5-cis-dihydrodiol dehydrogenase
MEGAYLAYLEFEDGAAASMAFSGYDHFDSDELHFWVGENGADKPTDRHGKAIEALAAIGSPEEETARRSAISFKAFLNQDRSGLHMPHHGVVIASCERGDIRPSPNGLHIYDANGMREEVVPQGPGLPGRTHTLDELYESAAAGVEPLHGAAWSKATLEVLLAIHESARERREIVLKHQTAVPE